MKLGIERKCRFLGKISETRINRDFANPHKIWILKNCFL